MDGEQRSQFAALVTDSHEWFSVAEDLRAAAQALEPAIEHYREVMAEREAKQQDHGGLLAFGYKPDPRNVYFMLVAFYIENVCKGTLIGRKRNELRNEIEASGRLPESVLGHCLEDKLERIGFPFNRGDLELVQRLNRSAVWAGRYPAPTADEHWSLFVEERGGVEHYPPWYSDNDVAKTKDLMRRIDAHINGTS